MTDHPTNPSTSTTSPTTSASPSPPTSAENPSLRSLVRSDDLVVSAVYTREIGASLERVWENVHDWEHLPWLHSEAFRSIESIDSGSWGWYARIGLHGEASPEIELELITDEPNRRYVSRTLKGAGSPSEIWTFLDPVAEDRTAIRVEFCVTPRGDEALHQIGEGYKGLYALLWTQDEEMMQTRESALARARLDRSADLETASLSLGPLSELRPKLPLVVEFGRDRFRIVELDGALFAHGVECPHLRGPLEFAEIESGEIKCPWHGYAFDVRTGRSCDGRGLRLRVAPRLEVDASSGEVVMRSAGSTG